MSYGHSAKGAVHPQSKGGVESQGAVEMQRWGWNAKGCGQIAKAFREWGQNAKGRAETRPDAILLFTLSFKPGKVKGLINDLACLFIPDNYLISESLEPRFCCGTVKTVSV